VAYAEFVGKYLKILYSRLRVGIYKSSIYRPHKGLLRTVEGYENSIENEPNFPTDNVIFFEELLEDLNKCSINGGYKKYFGQWIWVNHNIKYFPQNRKRIVKWGGIPNFIKKANLVYLENTIIYPNKFSDNFRQKYTFYIKQKKIQDYDLQKAITFNIGGSNSFQHFMQDCLPIIAKTKKFLLDNPEIPILIPKANSSFKNRNFILDQIGVVNKIIETDQIRSLKIRFLYFWNFSPYNCQYCLPPIFYKTLRQSIINRNLLVQNRAIVLLIRSEKMRKFKNQIEIIECLQVLAKLNRLELLIVDTSIEDINSVSKKIKQALIIIGIHGGNTYNTIFCQDDCTVIEILPLKNTNSNINFISYSGIKYVPFPSDFDFFDSEVDVSTKDLEMVVSRILNSNT
jgi:hypothetical protein